jgi:hypothetical protein
MWSLAWWPYAIAHGLNPFVSHVIFPPGGLNLTAVASIPTASLLMTPFTLAFGPLVSYNLMALLAPPLASFTAYHLAVRVTGRQLPSIAGGYLFGFSAYTLSQLTNHPNLFLVFLIPAMAELIYARAMRQVGRRTFVASLAVMFVLQLGLSSELLFDSVLLGASALIAWTILLPRGERRIVWTITGDVVVSGLIAIVLASPFLYYAISAGSPPNLHYSSVLGMDFLNPFFPTPLTHLGRHYFETLAHMTEAGDIPEQDGYLGFPLLLIFITYVVGRWRQSGTRLLLILTTLSTIVAFGSYLHVAGIQTIPMPFGLISNLPFFRGLVPSRFAVFTALGVAIVVACWLAIPHKRQWLGWATVLVAAIFLYPNISSDAWSTPPVNPRFFTSGLYRHYLTAGADVLVLPFFERDVSMLWQGETDFYFKMPDGYLGLPSETYTAKAPPQLASAFYQLNDNGLQPISPSDIKAFMIAHAVRQVVIDTAVANPWSPVMTGLGLRAQSVGGVLVYQVPATFARNAISSP